MDGRKSYAVSLTCAMQLHLSSLEMGIAQITRGSAHDEIARHASRWTHATKCKTPHFSIPHQPFLVCAEADLDCSIT